MAGSFGISVGFLVSLHIPSSTLGDQWNQRLRKATPEGLLSPHWVFSREEAQRKKWVSGVGPAAVGKSTCICLQMLAEFILKLF